MKTKDILFIMIIVAILSLVGNLIGYKNGIIESLPGMLILVGICVAGVLLSKIIPIKIPSVAYIVLIGCLLTFPDFPFASSISAYVKKVNFLSLTTPILAYSGISIGKDLDSFAKIGWKLVLLSCFVFIGTYLSSAIIAQIILKAIGQI
ncbi:DUF340 domain-containing protein [Clostridium ganghwense]|uniref:DUF340 domain-containing protein n=1 Tax=Clostridium ganghwense TaxID=312089 RepID=A0ABT4CL41_9CLOT|nr:DUF340 domain-containing protein [Clostridium ganghwense]MCY6369770.1 DUF340 domain-containing protein [Clostridium ganghwense]